MNVITELEAGCFFVPPSTDVAQPDDDIRDGVASNCLNSAGNSTATLPRRRRLERQIPLVAEI
jgi:hypothetical protein